MILHNLLEQPLNQFSESLFETYTCHMFFLLFSLVPEEEKITTTTSLNIENS